MATVVMEGPVADLVLHADTPLRNDPSLTAPNPAQIDAPGFVVEWQMFNPERSELPAG